MPNYHPADRVRWSLNCRPTVRPTIGDRALWSDFTRLHRDVPRVPGIVTHPSTVDPVLYRHNARTLGDSHAKMASKGFYSFAPTVEQLTDTAAVDGGTVERGAEPTYVRPTEDASGATWSMDRIGSGNHLRGAPHARDLRVNGAPMTSKPVKLSTYRRWAALVSFLSGATVPDPASQWAVVAALVSLWSGRAFLPRPMDSHVLIGATVVPAKATQRPRSEDGKRPRQTRQAVAEAALDLLTEWFAEGEPPRTGGRPTNPERVARFAYAEHGPVPADQLPAVLAEALDQFVS